MFLYMFTQIGHLPKHFCVYCHRHKHFSKAGKKKKKNHVSSFVNIRTSAVFQQMNTNRFPKLIHASFVHLSFKSLFPKFIKGQKSSFHISNIFQTEVIKQICPLSTTVTNVHLINCLQI